MLKRGKMLLAGLLLLMPMVASAQTVNDYGIDNLAAGNINLGTRPIGETVAGIVNIVLGFLGILATLLILYGGFVWMTSGGSSDKVDTAKKIIGSGVVGLVIILTAYAISRFVLSAIHNEVRL